MMSSSRGAESQGNDSTSAESQRNDARSVSDDRSTFSEKAHQRGLTEVTVTALVQAGFYTEDLLCQLNDIKISDLSVTVGQKPKIRKWVDDCKSESLENFDRQAYNKGLDDETVQEFHRQDIKSAGDLKEIGEADIDHLRMSLPQKQRLLIWHRELHSIPISHEVFDEGDVQRNLLIRPNIMNELTEYRQQYWQQKVMKKPEDFMKYLDKVIRKYPHKIINIAITGHSGKGKSYFVNTLRHLTPTDPGAAAVDTLPGDQTKLVKPYGVKDMEHAAIWDLPGYGTPGYPKNTYLEKVNFGSYDIVVIFFGSELSEGDMFVATEAKKLSIPFYFVYSKIDEELQSADCRKDHEEIHLELLTEQTLAKLPGGQWGKKVYIISNKEQHQIKWDFQQLKKDIRKHVKLGKQDILTLAVIDFTKQLFGDIESVINDATKCKEVKSIIYLVRQKISQYERMFNTPCTQDLESVMKNSLKLKGVKDLQTRWFGTDPERPEDEVCQINVVVRKVFQDFLQECTSHGLMKLLDDKKALILAKYNEQ